MKYLVKAQVEFEVESAGPGTAYGKLEKMFIDSFNSDGPVKVVNYVGKSVIRSELTEKHSFESNNGTNCTHCTAPPFADIHDSRAKA